MILDFSVDTASIRELDDAINIMQFLRGTAPISQVVPVPRPEPHPDNTPPSLAKPARVKKDKTPPADPRQTEIPGTEQKIASTPIAAPVAASGDIKKAQDLTRAVMQKGKDGMAEAARLLGSVGALKVSEIPAERLVEYITLAEKALAA